ncbi:MAG: monovalent cation/H(+) antiporter subunit G [Lachnospiraceae bacterium]|nr:monovalent cation/H(+) antiporter subunit G [Lachnospiraceae bacterium]
MTVIGMIFDLLGLIFLILGIVIFSLEILGIIKFRFLLNRMHAAGMGDTLGISLCLLGLIFISGLNFNSLKLFLVVVFLWFASPTASHLISELEAVTDEKLGDNVKLEIEEEDLN